MSTYVDSILVLYDSKWVEIETLKNLMNLRNLSQADLAQLTGVSRQAVSRWFQKGRVFLNIRAKHLRALSQGLHIRMDDLMSGSSAKIPPEIEKGLENLLLWDRLYPDLTFFTISLLKSQPQAIARLVQVFGPFKAAKMIGSRVWQRFDAYKQFLPPVQRKEYAVLCALQDLLKTN